MHIADPDLGILGAIGIVGAGLVIANGAAFSAQYRGTDQVAVCFFGDGASNTGTFHEGLNLASLWQLPVVFVCENNAYAESTPQDEHQRIRDVAVRAKSYDMPGVIVDGNDVKAVYHAAGKAVQRARSGGGPTLIEAKTYRLRGHYEGDPQSYRSREEVDRWRERCPIALLREALLQQGTSAEEIAAIDARVEVEIEAAVAFAEESPHPDVGEARSGIFTIVAEADW